jgi:photosystem II stability/assembly factor-like uncharacterized protein
MLPILLAAAPFLGQPTPSDIPAGTDITWRNVGPGGGGWIQSMTCDPQRADVLHVGCDVGGYYRSDDGGLTYHIQNAGLRDYFVESIAVCPSDPRIILLGSEGGLYKSTDDGMTWRWIREGFPEPQRYAFAAPIGCVAFDPSETQRVYAGIGRPRWGKDGQGRIYVSDDRGESWRVGTPEGTLPGDAIVSDIEVAPGEESYVLAATTKGLYRSADRGVAWQKVEGLPQTWVQEIAIAPSDPKTAYATLRTTARDAEPWNGGVLRSEDGGLTWERRTEGLPQRVGKRDQPHQMTSTCKEIVVDPTDPDVVYVGDNAWVSAGVYKTADGGLHWERSAYRTQTESSFTDYGWITHWGPSVECMSISPLDPRRVTFGTSGQVFATEDAGAHWTQRYCRMLPDGHFAGTGLEVTCQNDIVFDPHDASRVYFCYFDIGLLTSEDGGQTFRRTVQGMKNNGNCFTVLPDPDDASVLWATTGEWGSNHGDVCRSTDGGKTWTVVGKPETGLPDGQTKTLRMDPNSPRGSRHLYVTSNGNGVYRSLDGGDTWECLNGNLPTEVAGRLRGLLLDPANAQHMRIAVAGSPAKGAGLYETTDGGATWTKVNRNTEFGDIQDFDMGESFDTLYVCQRDLYDREVEPPVMRPGGVYKSTNGGVTWTRVLAYHFVRCLTVSPLDARVLYVGTTDHPFHDDSIAAGVLKSEDAGQTWQSENTGLSSLQISCLSVRPRTDGGADLVLGTGGNGAFLGIDASPRP